MELSAFWKEHPSAALAFSGGVDSAYLLWSAVEAGANVTAYFVKTEFQPHFELEDARRLAERLHVKLTIIGFPILEDAQIAANPPERCYHCKRRIFSAILEHARKDGYTVLLDGTNASDDDADRPGVRALRELQVLSPLRLCGLTKEEIRRRSREAGLFTWDKPAYACLATRVPTGTALTEDLLRKIEDAETQVASLGFTNFRVRLTAEGCKLQVPESQLSTALAQRQQLVGMLAPLFGSATLDLQPRPEEPLRDGAFTDAVTELRCNLDDMTGEDIAFAAERLMEEGALDVWTTAITMKKGRPAVLLTCLCRTGEESRFTDLLLRHTTTLGVRQTACSRVCLARTVRDCGGVRIKSAAGHGIAKEKAEFDDLAAMARREGLSLAEVRRNLGLIK